MLNYEMTDIFSMLGIGTEGGEFLFVKDRIPISEKAQLFNMARNPLGLPIDDDYIYQELGIEMPQVHDECSRMAKLMTDSNGNLRSFDEWVKEAEPISKHHNEVWLRTEYDTAVRRA